MVTLPSNRVILSARVRMLRARPRSHALAPPGRNDMLRVVIVTGLSAISSGQAVASCNFGALDYQNCLYREQMDSAGGSSAPGVTSRPNPVGGYDYSNGVTSRANPQGGYDYSNGVTCRRNPFGGLDCR